MKRGTRFTLLAAAILSAAVLGCKRENSSQNENASASRDPKASPVVDAGCPHMVDGECQHAPPREPKPHTQAGTMRFGAPLGDSPETQLAEVLAAPDAYHQKTVRLSGHVSRACSRKGCWMELAVDASPAAPRCRVTFQDYAFFVPTDAAGSRAKLEGVVQVTEVKAEAVDHYESEGATFTNKDADGSAKEVRLVASGVELERG
jgi:hypothetical protein